MASCILYETDEKQDAEAMQSFLFGRALQLSRARFRPRDLGMPPPSDGTTNRLQMLVLHTVTH